MYSIIYTKGAFFVKDNIFDKNFLNDYLKIREPAIAIALIILFLASQPELRETIAQNLHQLIDHLTTLAG